MAKKKSKNYLNIILIFLIVLSVTAIVYVVSVQEKEPVVEGIKKETRQEEKQKSVSVIPQKQKVKKKKSGISRIFSIFKKKDEKKVISKIEKMPLPKMQVAIIIDDIGYQLEPVKELIEVDADITFSILPFLSHSREAAEILRREKKEILLHLPMEPVSYPIDKPGEGALFTDMNDKELMYQLEKNLNAVPYISGVNNHMGSKFMTNREKLVLVFGQLKERNLFFIDSRTTVESEAIAAAKTVGLPLAERKIFIDNNREYNEIYKNLMSVLKYKNDISPVIVIGHPYPETIRAIKDAAGVLRKKGVLIVPVSKIMKKESISGIS